MIYGSQGATHLATKKKLFKSGQIYREDKNWSDNDFSNNWFFLGPILIFWDIANFINDFVHDLQVFGYKKWKWNKLCLSQKMVSSDRSFYIHEVFFCAILRFWVIYIYLHIYLLNFCMFDTVLIRKFRIWPFPN